MAIARTRFTAVVFFSFYRPVQGSRGDSKASVCESLSVTDSLDMDVITIPGYLKEILIVHQVQKRVSVLRYQLFHGPNFPYASYNKAP